MTGYDAPRWTSQQFHDLFERLAINDGQAAEAPAGERPGAMRFLTDERVAAATRLVRSGQTISMSLPVNTVAGPDNPNPALHHMVQGYDTPSADGVQFATDFLGMQFHGDCHTHIDALCHIAYQGRLYGGRQAAPVVTTRGASALDITAYQHGIVGRGVLLDVPRFREVDWLEPGEAVTRAELEDIEEAQGVRLGEGDIFVFRTGHHRRREQLGAWDNSYAGAGKAGLHVDTMALLAERRVAAFFPDGDGEAVPSSVEGVDYPIHPLQIAALGMAAADSLNLEDIAEACAREQRWEFLVVAAPLRAPGVTGSPFNPIAVL